MEGGERRHYLRHEPAPLPPSLLQVLHLPPSVDYAISASINSCQKLQLFNRVTRSPSVVNQRSLSRVIRGSWSQGASSNSAVESRGAAARCQVAAGSCARRSNWVRARGGRGRPASQSIVSPRPEETLVLLRPARVCVCVSDGARRIVRKGWYSLQDPSGASSERGVGACSRVVRGWGGVGCGPCLVVELWGRHGLGPHTLTANSVQKAPN